MLDSVFRRRATARPEIVKRIEDWTRRRFKLSDEVVVSVSQIECLLPGCPPLETVVSFWEGEDRYHFKVFKTISDVKEDDLPFAWMKDAIKVAPGWECDCC